MSIGQLRFGVREREELLEQPSWMNWIIDSQNLRKTGLDGTARLIMIIYSPRTEAEIVKH